MLVVFLFLFNLERMVSIFISPKPTHNASEKVSIATAQVNRVNSRPKWFISSFSSIKPRIVQGKIISVLKIINFA